jgi:ribosomal protein S12 methylthiotransferase accessory factor
MSEPVIEPWRDLVSPRVGIVRELRPQLREAAEPEPPHLWTAELAHYDFRPAPRADRMTAGKGRTEAAAKAAAVGEAVERYCAAHRGDPDRSFVAALADVPTRAFSPADGVLYAAEQYARDGWPYPPWRPETPLTWVRGAALVDGEPVALPAGLVHLSRALPRPEDALVQSTSNGLAAGATLEEALLGGLCEVVERDALLVTWMNRLPATELDVSAAGGPAGAVARHYAALGVEVRCFVLPTDLPATVVLALALEDAPDRPATVAAAGCSPSPARALEKAVFELCQARPAEAFRFRDRPPAGRLTRYEDVVELDDHSAFAAQPERRGEFAFLWADGRRTTLAALPDRSGADPAGTLARCAEELARLGCPAAYAELTTPDVAPSGYRVVRVLAAGLQPIAFGSGRERLGGDRLLELPHRLGLAPTRRTVADLNPCPHPMA